MPLALLLQGVIKTISKGAKQLTPWAMMAYLEELLVDRARGAFMVHWFGSSLPLEGLQIRIAIANLDELRMRFNEVLAERNRRTTATGLNLLDPLAGLAGTVAGMLVSPAGQLMLMIALEQHLSSLWQGLGHMLNWLSGGLLGAGVGIVVGVAALPLAMLGTLAMLATDPESVRRVYNFLGAMAELMNATRQFIGLLLGPREAIRNPLLRRILEIADNISNVTMAAIGAFALLITRISPLLLPLPGQLRAFYNLLQPVQEIFTVLITDLRDRLTALFEGDRSPANRAQGLLGVLTGGFSEVNDVFHILLGEVSAFFTWGWQSVERAFSGGETDTQSVMGWFSIIKIELAQAFTLHPTIQVILRLIDVFKAAAPHFRSTSPSAPSSGISARIKQAVLDAVLPPSLPDFPALPQLPDTDALQAQLDVPPDLNLGTIQLFAFLTEPFRVPEFEPLAAEVQAAARRATRPRSYFAAERRRLTEELGRSPTEALEQLYQEQIPFRSALMDVIASQAAEFVPELRQVFEAIDRHIFERTAEQQPAAEQQSSGLFPVRIVPEVEYLRPDIGELRIRIIGVEQPVANAWGRSLQAVLQAQSYRAEFA
jgi:hypothetical protein